MIIMQAVFYLAFAPDSKLQMLMTMKDDAEIVIAICAADIENSKLQGDLGIPYDQKFYV